MEFQRKSIVSLYTGWIVPCTHVVWKPLGFLAFFMSSMTWGQPRCRRLKNKVHEKLRGWAQHGSHCFILFYFTLFLLLYNYFFPHWQPAGEMNTWNSFHFVFSPLLCPPPCLLEFFFPFESVERQGASCRQYKKKREENTEITMKCNWGKHTNTLEPLKRIQK